jgi:hypothetical protein
MAKEMIEVCAVAVMRLNPKLAAEQTVNRTSCTAPRKPV